MWVLQRGWSGIELLVATVVLVGCTAKEAPMVKETPRAIKVADPAPEVGLKVYKVESGADLEIRSTEELGKLKGYGIVEGSLRLKNLRDISALSMLEVVRGDFELSDCGLLDLRALANLRRVEGTLRIDVERITSLAGLSKLEYIGGDFKVSGSKLWGPRKGLIGFTALREIAGKFDVFACGSDRDTPTLIFGPWANLKRVGGDVLVRALCRFDNITIKPAPLFDIKASTGRFEFRTEENILTDKSKWREGFELKN